MHLHNMHSIGARRARSPTRFRRSTAAARAETQGENVSYCLRGLTRMPDMTRRRQYAPRSHAIGEKASAKCFREIEPVPNF